MKRKLLYIYAIGVFFIGTMHVNAQCLESIEGQYPDATLTPECVGAPENLVNDGYASEYSKVQLSAGETYVFSSSIATDFITIGDENGTTALAFGVSPVTYTPTASGVIRFYLHTDAQCGGESMIRSRRVQCGTVPVCNPKSIPYTQGFEPGEVACITYLDVNGSSGLSGWEVDSFFPTFAGDRSMIYTYDEEFPGDDWFFTDGLSLVGGTSYTLEFKYRSGIGPDFLENLEVKYGSANTAAGMNMPLLNFVGLTTNFGSPFATGTANFTPATSGTYYIGFRSFSDANEGYIQIDNISVNTSLAVNSFDNIAISYFPNPVKDILHFNNAEKFNGIEVYNVLGQKVLSKTGSAAEINLSSLTAGAYILKLKGEFSAKTVKIIKE